MTGTNGVFLRRVGSCRGQTTELVSMVLYLVGDIEIDATVVGMNRQVKLETIVGDR